MKTRQYILSAAAVLLAAAPLAATAGEGNLWVELRDLHAQLTQQRTAMATGERAGMAGPAGPVMGEGAQGARLDPSGTRGGETLFETISRSHRALDAK